MTEQKAADALNSLNATLLQVATTYDQYKVARTGASTTLGQNQAINAQLTDADLELRQLAIEEETLNKRFLDARKVGSPTGVFARLGLSTIQDWSLAAFFATFGLFCILLTAFLATASIYWVRVAVFGLILTVILLGGSALLIRILG